MAADSFVNSRRKARKVALQVLYEVDSVGHPQASVTPRVLAGTRLNQEGKEFVQTLVEGVVANSAQLDEVIAKYAVSWPVSQLSVVDRCLLRLAIYELTVDGSQPPKAIINETVDLAKAFGGDGSPKFVNGVLGSVLDETQTQPV